MPRTLHMQPLYELFDIRVADNTVKTWSLAILAFLVTFTVLPLLKTYLLRVARRPVHMQEFGAVQLILRLIPRTSRLFIWVLALNAADRFLNLPHRFEEMLKILVLVGIWFQIGLWAMTAIDFLLDRHQQRRGVTDVAFASSLGIVNFVARVMIWSFAILLALDNLGVNITTLVTGLGIGGVAIALAVQTMLSDLLASLSIALDKPFTVGDALAVDNINGTVEQIGVRTTRLRSIDGEQIIMSNADLIKSRVRNFGRMGERRGVLSLVLSYDTAIDKVRKVNAIVEAAIKAQQKARFERCYFREIGATGLNFDASYFITDGNFNTLVAAQQDINFRIIEAFEHEGIDLATPLQTIAKKTT
jgi:small-conductance mechanosensitive channel